MGDVWGEIWGEMEEREMGRERWMRDIRGRERGSREIGERVLWGERWRRDIRGREMEERDRVVER